MNVLVVAVAIGLLMFAAVLTVGLCWAAKAGEEDDPRATGGWWAASRRRADHGR